VSRLLCWFRIHDWSAVARTKTDLRSITFRVVCQRCNKEKETRFVF